MGGSTILLNGISVIITRPLLQAESLKQALLASGARVLVVPGLEISPLENERLSTIWLDLDRFQHVIFTSVNAARIGMESLSQYWPQWPLGVEWYAVGAGTASVLSDFHIKAHVPENYSSEGLLALPGLTKLSEQTVLIVKGLGGRTLLAETIEARGAEIRYAEVYRRDCPPLPDWVEIELKKLLDGGGPLVMVVSSVESLNNLEELLAPHWSRICQVPLVVLSRRIAEQAEKKGFERITVSARPDDDAVITALKSVYAGC